MYNKKIIAKGLAFGIVLSNVQMDATVNAIEEYKTIIEKREISNSKKRNLEKRVEPKNQVKVNKNIIKGSVIEITLSDGDYVPDLTGNPNSYETIKVSTTGSKMLVKQDYINLKNSGIPNIDLSSAYSDYIPAGAFSHATYLTDIKFPQGVTDIQSRAFEGCIGFTGDLVIPDSVTSIGINAFNRCSGFTGSLTIPNSVTTIGWGAFYGCSGFTGNLVIPNSVTSIDYYAFYGCNKIEKILIKVNSSDSNTDYKKSIIDNLPDTHQTVIDIPYNFNITGTWLETTNKTIGKPVIKSVIDGIESELVDNKGEAVSLYIPSLYQESNITVLKDDKPFNLPVKNSEEKHIFTEAGVYEVTVLTDLGNTSVINFEVEDPKIKNAEEAINKAENSNELVDIENARDLVNKLPESIIKDQLQDRLDAISPNLTLDRKNTTSNVDVYIKSENMLSMSLNTNSIIFDDFSGIDNMEKKNAVELIINSSLPYQLNAYLPTEIQNSNNSNTMDKQILNIKENSENDYQTFANTTDKIILKDNNQSGNDLAHNIDLKVKGGIAHKKDVYKATIKFEAEQK